MKPLDPLFHELIHKLSGAEEPQRLLDRILDAAVAMTHASTGSIVLIDKATSSLSIEAARGFADRTVKATRLKIGKGITGWVAAKARTVRVDDVRKDKRYFRLKRNIRSEMAAPLSLDSEVIGVINVDSTKVAAFNDEDQAALEILATLSSRVIADALIHDRLRKRSRQLQTLVRIGLDLTSVVSPEKILGKITSAAADLIAANLVTVRLLDVARENLTLAAIHGGSEKYVLEAPIPTAGSAIGSVALTQMPLIIENIPTESGFRFKSIAREERLKSMLAVPLVTAGRSLGVLAVYRDRVGDFDEDAVTIAVGLASLAAAALENSRLFANVIESDRRIRQSERRNAASEMSAELAHEIRNPLTTVRMLVGAIGGSAGSAPSGRATHGADSGHGAGHSSSGTITPADHAVILRELDRVDGLIKRLLGNASQEHARFEQVALDTLLDEIVTVSQIKAGAKNVLITKFGRAGVVRGDRDELWQAFSNIVDNAIHAARKRIRITAQYRVTRNRMRAEINFEDDGAGVPDNVPIFDPLMTTKETGVGIGLFSARRIIHAHGGEITYGHSRKLGGAVFRVLLPVSEAD